MEYFDVGGNIRVTGQVRITVDDEGYKMCDGFVSKLIWGLRNARRC